jgi:hypothetical protein
MHSRHERIELIAKALKRLDPERKLKLEDAFKNHLADAIRASSQREYQLEIDNAMEAYEDALNRTLYELLDNQHFATEEDSSVA